MRNSGWGENQAPWRKSWTLGSLVMGRTNKFQSNNRYYLGSHLILKQRQVQIWGHQFWDIYRSFSMCFNPDSPKIEAIETWHCGQVKLSLRASQVRVAPACSSLVPRTCSVAWETRPKASLEPQSITRQWNSTSNLITSVSLVLLFKVIIATQSLTTVTMVSSCRVPHHSGPPSNLRGWWRRY